MRVYCIAKSRFEGNDILCCAVQKSMHNSSLPEIQQLLCKEEFLTDIRRDSIIGTSNEEICIAFLQE